MYPATDESLDPGSLYERLYEQLHDIAGAMMRNERADHTLQPTALINEAFLRLKLPEQSPGEEWRILAFAANAMRQVLIDHARRRQALKRSGGRQRVSLDTRILGDESDQLDVLVLDEALQRLAAIDDRKARVVEMKYFSRMTNRQIGMAVGVSEKTVESDWYFARAWLRRELEPSEQ